MLLAKAGHPIPDDPYSLVAGVSQSKELREHAKTTLAALLNAPSGNTKEPRNFDEDKHGMTADAFRQSLHVAFPMLQGLLGQNTGMRLQRDESDLAELVMLHFIDQGLPILPIHDGPVALSCRPKCSFKPLSVRRRQGFSNLMLSGGVVDYRSR